MAATSFWGLISESVLHSSALEQGVLAFLILLSIVSWAVIIMKLRALSRLKVNHQRFHEAFAAAAHTGEVLERGRPEAGPSLLHGVFAAGIAARAQARADAAVAVPVAGDHIPMKTAKNVEERVRLAMEHALKRDMSGLGAHMTILATAGSASPFIGLFGTVWGIMATFQTLGSAKSASLQVLAPPIAAALIATAAGLAVAIPAVMFYNWISARLEQEHQDAGCVMERVLHLLRGTGAVDEIAAAPAPASATTAPAATAPATVPAAATAALA